MKGAIYFIIMGAVIGILTLIKPKFFWHHPKANFVKRFLGERGTTIFYLLASVVMVTYGIYTMTKINTVNELEEISAMYQNGQIEETQTRLLTYTAKHSDDYLAWTILGHTYLDQENIDKAIECYNNGVKADSKAFQSYSGLGLAYSKKEDYEKAKEQYLIALSIEPNSGSVVGNLASLYDNLGDIKKSIEFGEKSIKLDSENSTLFANLSIYYNKDKQFGKRDEMFNKAKELGYDDMESLTKTYELYNDTTTTEK